MHLAFLYMHFFLLFDLTFIILFCVNKNPKTHKKPSGPKHIVVTNAFGHLRPHCSKFQALKRIKRKNKLELLGSCALQAKPDLIESGKLLKHGLMLLPPYLCASPVIILPTLVSLLIRQSFQTIVSFG